jgi:hypothetical protein
LFVARFSVSVSRPGRSGALDGGWFLAPAALLGAGIAAGAYATDAAGVLADLLCWVALVAAGVGTTGYWAAVLGSAIAVARRGLGDSRRVLWWIAAGCGGLAAAGLARALSAGGGLWPTDVVTLALWTVTAALHASRLLPSTGRQPTTPTYGRDDPTVPTRPPEALAPPPR